MDINPNDYPSREVYKLITGAVVPRPIAWVSTVSSDGQPNLAPFSFFNAVCSNPPTVLFCTGIRGADQSPKDTYHNVRATGEFVINFVTERLAAAMNITATELPAEVNEFEKAGLTSGPGKQVRVPHVVESPIHFECKLREIVTISEEPGGGYIIIGTIVHMYFGDSIYREGNYIDFAAYQPIGRLTGSGYTRVNDLFELVRPPAQIKPD
ncbi:MAG: flavin reductase family protein [Anaerolineae bacterium]|nr:flavin reductase family protein [Anaerolineae bacterium]